MKTFLVIPAFNEEKIIGNVLDNLIKAGYKDIIVVDDGSSDKTGLIAKKKGAIVIRHLINRGLGGSLGTGIKVALLKNADIIVTFDADGQHDPCDVKNVIAPLEKCQTDVVIGSRLINSKGMPWIRILFNKIGNMVTFLLFGLYVTDSQSGLRAFSKEAASKIEIRTNRMEVSSEIIREIKKNNLKLMQVPIKAIYTSYSLSKGINFFVGIKMFLKLLIHRLMS